MAKIIKISDKATKAVIEKCQCDAMKHVAKRLGISRRDDVDGTTFFDPYSIVEKFHINELKMHKSYSGIVSCDERDAFSDVIGESEAVKKAMANHNVSFKKAIKRWQVAVLKELIKVDKDIFGEALHEVYECKCNK